MVAKPLPFTELGELRTFAADVDAGELQWHWDEQDRIVIPQHETDWLLQLDNELPQEMREGLSYYIPIGAWHRVIKGTGSFTVRVIKNVTTPEVSHSEPAVAAE